MNGEYKAMGKGGGGWGEHTWKCFELVVRSAIVRNIKIRFTVERLPLLRYVKDD